MLSLYISELNSTVYNSSVKQIPGGSPNSTTFLGVLIFSLIIWSRSGKKHMVTFPLRPVTFPGYVFTSNTGDDTGIQLALSKDTRVGIEEFIASGKAGKPNRTTHHSMPYSGISHFDRRLIFSPATNQSTFGISLDPFICSLPNYFGFTAGLDFLHNFIAATEVLVSATKPV